jgi:ribonucleoside-triphosphate reductase
MNVIKRDGTKEKFSKSKLNRALSGAFSASGKSFPQKLFNSIVNEIMDWRYREDPTEKSGYSVQTRQSINVEEIQDIIEKQLMMNGYYDIARNFIIYRKEHQEIREWAQSKKDFIEKYKASYNTADATIDDNSNMACKNIAVLNNEIHKEDNLLLNRYMVTQKLKELYPDFDAKQYSKDLDSHVIYKHDESSFAGAIAPYCVALTMYPFLENGIREVGGLSAAPKNLDSFCGMYVNLIFAVSSQFAGAVATPEFLLYFDYFARKEWGNGYWKYPQSTAKIRYSDSGPEPMNQVSIQKQIHQYFQQVVYTINQPAAARGMQSAFVNFSYFDRPFFDGMFGDFVFPDFTKPNWESFNWLQHEFMQWFNEERLRCVLTFPVESFALVYKDGKFLDQESADFVAKEYAEGHSFFTYISDTVDSLSSCCRLKNKLTTKEFNFTNGNIGLQTGSKSVITLNLSRIVQDWALTQEIVDKIESNDLDATEMTDCLDCFCSYLGDILERVYKYHTAYDSILRDMESAHLLPVYSAGFINLNKQYLTIGINGLNEMAEFLGIECHDSWKYSLLCQKVFGYIKQKNLEHKTKETMFNTECVPAESLAIKNYNWDKADGYWVPENRNLYASYIYVPSDKSLSILDKIHLHGKDYIGDYLDGGSAAHLNLAEHLSKEQYSKILEIAAQEGCQYFTFNVPNSECSECHYITKHPISKCPKCGSEKIWTYDRIIGYLTKIQNWSEGRRIEQKTRVYLDPDKTGV